MQYARDQGSSPARQYIMHELTVRSRMVAGRHAPALASRTNERTSPGAIGALAGD